MFCNRTSLIILCLFVNANAWAQLENQIDPLFADFQNTPGAAIGVYQNGKLTFSKGYGLANLDYSIPISPNTIFDIGSVSKQFTAACIFLLEEQGKLSIDDPIQKFLPEIPIYNGDIVTIRNLINHTSGLRDYVEILDYASIPFDNVFTEEMGLAMMARQKEPNFKPGEKFMYNNGGYLLLAIIVRRASGKSIGEFAKANIFEPLAMSHSFILENPNRIIKNLATGYIKKGDGTFEKQHHLNFAIGGDGQVYTSVENLLEWDNNFYSQKIGGPNFLKRMHERGILNNRDTLPYAGGLFIDNYKGHKLVQHGGAWGGFRAIILRLPDLHASVVVLANYPGAMVNIKAYQILDLLIKPVESKEKNKPKTIAVRVAPKKLAGYTGIFEIIGQPHKRFTCALEGDSLVIEQLWNYDKFKLVPLSTSTFHRNGFPEIQFVFDPITQLPIVNNQLETLQTKKVHAFNISANTNLTGYDGEYFSAEVNATYTIVEKAGQLIVSQHEKVIATLYQVSSDVFGANQLGYEFQREAGVISGFLLHDRRIRNLKFQKVK